MAKSLCLLRQKYKKQPSSEGLATAANLQPNIQQYTAGIERLSTNISLSLTTTICIWVRDCIYSSHNHGVRYKLYIQSIKSQIQKFNAYYNKLKVWNILTQESRVFSP